MLEKFLKLSNLINLSGIIFLFTFPFIFPSYINPEILFWYKTIMITVGVIFILENKFLKTEIKIETPIDEYLFLIFIWYIISIFFAYDFFISLNSTIDFFIFLLFFYVLYIYSIQYFRFFVLFIIFIAFILSLYGLYQYFWGFDLTLKYVDQKNIEFLEEIKNRLLSKRIFSTFIYPNTFAGFLILVLPVSIGFFKIEKNFRLILMPFILVMILALVFTKSIGAFFSLIVALLLSIIFVSDKSLKNFKTLFMILLFILILFFIFILNLRGLNAIFPNIIGKIESYIKMTDIILKKFLTGYGPGSFEVIYNTSEIKSNYLKYAHNIFFQIFIESGLIGIILFFLALFYGYKIVIENFFFLRTTYKKVLIFSLLTGITAFLIHNLIDFDINNFELNLVFILFVAIIFAHTNIYMLYVKKIKLNYILGVAPLKRKNIIFFISILLLVLCAITGGRNPIIFSLILILIIAGFAIWSVSKEDIKHTELDIPLILILIISYLSLFNTPFLYKGLDKFAIIFSGILIFYFSLQFLDRIYYKVFISNFIIFIGIILGLINILQRLYNMLFNANIMTSSFFPNPNLYAGFMLIPFSFILNKIFIQKKHEQLFLKIVTLYLFIFFIAIVNSKGGILSMLFIFVFFYFYYKKNQDYIKDIPQMKEFKNKLLKITFLIILILSFLPITPAGKKVIEIKSDPFYFNRIKIYKASIKMALDKFLTGWGLGSYERVFPRYNFPIERTARYQMEANFAHNEILHFWVETGIIGFVIMIMILYKILKNIPVYEGHKKLWATKSGAYFAVLGVIFHSLFDFNLHLPGIFLTSAMITAFFIKEKTRIITVPNASLIFTKIYFFPALILTFIFLGLAVKPGLSYIFYKEYENKKDSKILLNVFKINPINSKYLLEIGKIFENRAEINTANYYFKKALIYDKFNYIIPLHLARNFIILNDLEKAQKYYEIAILNNPYRAFTYAEVAQVFLEKLSDNNKAKEYYKKAISIEPYYFVARNNLALILKQKGEMEKAEKEFLFIEENIGKVNVETEYEKELTFLDKKFFYLNLAKFYEDIKNNKKACVYYNKILKENYDEKIAEKVKKICK